MGRGLGPGPGHGAERRKREQEYDHRPRAGTSTRSKGRRASQDREQPYRMIVFNDLGPTSDNETCRAMADAIRHNATLQEFVSKGGTSIANESSRAMTDAVNRP